MRKLLQRIKAGLSKIEARLRTFFKDDMWKHLHEDHDALD